MRVAEREQRETVDRPFWDRSILSTIPISRDLVVFGGIFLLALILRLWDLGPRMLHHDESLHATYSWYYYIGRGYRHDPMMHGPWQFTAMALSYFIFGVTEAAARTPHAIFGAMLAGLPYFIRHYIGRTGAIVTAILITLSPSFLYFSRFAREDAFVVFWTALAIVAVIRYRHIRRSTDLYILAAALSLGFSTKENTYISAGILLLFLLIASVVQYRNELASFFLGKRDGKAPLSPEGDLVVLISTLILPLFSAFVMVPFHLMNAGQKTPIEDQFLVPTLGLLTVISIFFGLRWSRERWIKAALIFWGIFIILHTSFLSNPAGIYSGTIGALKYWIDQQGVARGGQPFYYYWLIVPLYEFVVVSLGLVGIYYWLRRFLNGEHSFSAYLFIWWILLSQIIYAYTSEKMPWLVLHLALPFVLLSGLTLGRILETTDWRAAFEKKAVILSGVVIVSIAAFVSLVEKPLPFGASTETTLGQQSLFSWLGMAIVFAGLVALAIYIGRELGRSLALRFCAFGFLAVLMAYSVHVAWQASYYNGDVPVEMLVYTQTTRDVGAVMDQIEEITYRSGAQKETFKIAYDSGVSWPFEWYLRDYTSRQFYGSGAPATDAPVVLASFENGMDVKVKNLLGNRYVSQQYRLRAWFDETDYRAIGDNPSVLIHAITDPQAREKLKRFLLYREPLKPSGSTDFILFVRRDLATGPWVAQQAQAQTADDDQYTQRTRALSAILAVGDQRGNAQGQFADPKAVAVAPDGSIFVTDGGNHRVEKFDSTGRFLLSFGGQGAEDGKFNEPWGIAIDRAGKVYIADTWNHRIQVFDANGVFLAKWGGPGKLFGPRSVVINDKGEALVSDAGNHRIVVYDLSGNQVSTFGSRGAGEGQFNEPVGLALDRSGNLFVADTWNQRIQKFDSSYRPVAQWPFAGWSSENVTNKPYLATDPEGNVYATDPESARVVKFSGAGAVLAVWGKPGNDNASFRLPIGISTDEAGNVFIVDSQNSRVLKFAPVR